MKRLCDLPKATQTVKSQKLSSGFSLYPGGKSQVCPGSGQLFLVKFMFMVSTSH